MFYIILGKRIIRIIVYELLMPIRRGRLFFTDLDVYRFRVAIARGSKSVSFKMLLLLTARNRT